MSTPPNATTAATSSAARPAKTVANPVVTTDVSCVKVKFPVHVPCQDFLGEVSLDHFFSYAGIGEISTKKVTINVSPELREHVNSQLAKTFTYWHRLSKERRDQICNSEALWAIVKQLHDEIEVNHAIMFATLAGLGVAGCGVKQKVLDNRRAANEGISEFKKKNAAVEGIPLAEPPVFGPAFEYNAFNVYVPDPAAEKINKERLQNQSKIPVTNAWETESKALRPIYPLPVQPPVTKPETPALSCSETIADSPASPDEKTLVIDEDAE